MLYMTNQDFNKAKILERYFNTALHFNYVSSITGDALKVFRELCAAYGIQLNINCNGCVYNAIRQLAKMYYDKEEEIKQELLNFENVSEPTEPNEEAPKTEKPKLPKKPVQIKNNKPKK